MRVIEGNYDNGRFDDNNVVLGVSKGNFEVFQVSNKPVLDTDTEHMMYQKVELDAHYDDITFIEYEQGMLVTSSKDCTCKMYLLSIEVANRAIKINFDRSKADLKHLRVVDTKSVLTFCDSSRYVLDRPIKTNIKGFFKGPSTCGTLQTAR